MLFKTKRHMNFGLNLCKGDKKNGEKFPLKLIGALDYTEYPAVKIQGISMLAGLTGKGVSSAVDKAHDILYRSDDSISFDDPRFVAASNECDRVEELIDLPIGVDAMAEVMAPRLKYPREGLILYALREFKEGENLFNTNAYITSSPIQNVRFE